LPQSTTAAVADEADQRRDDAVSRNGELEKKIRDNKIFISIVFETRIGRRVATKTSTAEPNKNGKFA
jgi:hypothetical protein